jgi:hypothetical protein
MHSHVRTALLLASTTALAFFAGTASVRGADTRVQPAATAAPRPALVPLTPLSLPVYTTLPGTCTIGQVVLLESGPTFYSIQVCVKQKAQGQTCPPPQLPTSPSSTCVKDAKACRDAGGTPSAVPCSKGGGSLVLTETFPCNLPKKPCVPGQTTTQIGWKAMWTSPG